MAVVLLPQILNLLISCTGRVTLFKVILIFPNIIWFQIWPPNLLQNYFATSSTVNIVTDGPNELRLIIFYIFKFSSFSFKFTRPSNSRLRQWQITQKGVTINHLSCEIPFWKLVFEIPFFSCNRKQLSVYCRNLHRHRYEPW